MTLKLISKAAAIFTLSLFAACETMTLDEPGNLVPKTVDQDLSLPAISVAGTEFHTETFGNPDSAMIVMLHGGPGSDCRSILNAKELASSGYFVVFYDQRGSGLSKRHSKNTYTIQLMLDDLTAVIQHYRSLPGQKIFLFGHSWGAMLATAYVNAYPVAINGVILAEPGGFTFDDMKKYVSRARVIKPSGESTNDALYFDQFITGSENDHEILDYKGALAGAYSDADGNPEGNMGPTPFWRFGAVANSALFDIADKDGFDWTTNLHLYSTKVLFLYSERNAAYGLHWAQSVSSPYPSVQLEQINGSGHEMIHSGWNEVSPLAINYLNSLK